MAQERAARLRGPGVAVFRAEAAELEDKRTQERQAGTNQSFDNFDSNKYGTVDVLELKAGIEVRRSFLPPGWDASLTEKRWVLASCPRIFLLPGTAVVLHRTASFERQCGRARTTVQLEEYWSGHTINTSLHCCTALVTTSYIV